MNGWNQSCWMNGGNFREIFSGNSNLQLLLKYSTCRQNAVLKQWTKYSKTGLHWPPFFSTSYSAHFTSAYTAIFLTSAWRMLCLFSGLAMEIEHQLQSGCHQTIHCQLVNNLLSLFGGAVIREWQISKHSPFFCKGWICKTPLQIL